MKKIHFSGAGNTNVVKVNSHGNGILYHKCTLPRMFYYHKQLNAERWNLLSQVYNLKFLVFCSKLKKKNWLISKFFILIFSFSTVSVCSLVLLTRAKSTKNIPQQHTFYHWCDVQIQFGLFCPSGSGIELSGMCVPKALTFRAEMD